VVLTLGGSGLIYWWDGLIQLSFNHREMSFLAALLTGMALGRIPSAARGWWVAIPRAWACRLALLQLTLCTLLYLMVLWPWTFHERHLAGSRLALEEGRAMEALSEARKALRWHPEQAAGYRALAAARAAMGDDRSALRDLERAARLDPWRVSLALQRGDLLVSSRKPEQALEVLERVRPYYPSHPGLHRKRAEVLLAIGQLGPAVEAARLAVQYGYLNLEQDQAFLRQLEQKVSPSSGSGGTGSATHIPGSGS
jgi:tetratricopeptide (TPR) repeat protein